MGAQRKDGIHLSTQKLIQERRPNDRQDDGEEERKPWRRRIRHSDDPIFHKPRRQEPIHDSKARVGESEKDPAKKKKKYQQSADEARGCIEKKINCAQPKDFF
jgi:hypothetical protein